MWTGFPIGVTIAVEMAAADCAWAGRYKALRRATEATRSTAQKKRRIEICIGADLRKRNCTRVKG
jgi:hypothetical protein